MRTDYFKLVFVVDVAVAVAVVVVASWFANRMKIVITSQGKCDAMKECVTRTKQ